jgi:hypothetical protein
MSMMYRIERASINADFHSGARGRIFLFSPRKIDI